MTNINSMQRYVHEYVWGVDINTHVHQQTKGTKEDSLTCFLFFFFANQDAFFRVCIQFQLRDAFMPFIEEQLYLTPPFTLNSNWIL